MRARLSAIALTALLLGACASGDDGAEDAATAPAAEGTAAEAAAGSAVTIAGLAYEPAELTVPAGTEVTWTNDDGPAHTVTFDDGEDSGNLVSGDTYARTFDQAGSFPYVCSIHSSMTGTVTVE